MVQLLSGGLPDDGLGLGDLSGDAAMVIDEAGRVGRLDLVSGLGTELFW